MTTRNDDRIYLYDSHVKAYYILKTYGEGALEWFDLNILKTNSGTWKWGYDE